MATRSSRSLKGELSEISFRPASIHTEYLRTIYLTLEDQRVVLWEVENDDRSGGMVEVMRVPVTKAGLAKLKGWMKDKGHRAVQLSGQFSVPELIEDAGFPSVFEVEEWVRRVMEWEV